MKLIFNSVFQSLFTTFQKLVLDINMTQLCVEQLMCSTHSSWIEKYNFSQSTNNTDEQEEETEENNQHT